jgi:hypothetical protein
MTRKNKLKKIIIKKKKKNKNKMGCYSSKK